MHLEEELAQSVLCESFILLLLLFNKNSDVIAQKHRVQLDKVSVKQSLFFFGVPSLGCSKGRNFIQAKSLQTREMQPPEETESPPETILLLRKIKV